MLKSAYYECHSGEWLLQQDGNWTRRDKDGEGEGERYFRLADTKVCQECAEVLRIGKLLSLIH